MTPRSNTTKQDQANGSVKGLTRGHAIWLKKVALSTLIGGTVLLSACGGNNTADIPVITPTSVAIQQPIETPNIPSPTPELSADKIAELLKPSTVLVHADFPETVITDAGQGAGTGIIFTSDGYIMTNAHVVEGASSVEISMDGNSHKRSARVVGISSCDDLAVLKVDDRSGLVPAKLGHSGSLKRGEHIFTLGYPESFETDDGMSINQGIVSKLDVTLGAYESLVQVDAAINPGNSGGPLVNAYGEVVGINTLKLTTEHTTNMNYAISLDQARDVVEQLKQGHNMQWLGMNLVPNDYAKHFGTEDGMVVAAVDSGSSAAKVGVPSAALLLKLAGSDINSKADVCKILRSHADGDTLSVTLYYPTKTDQWQLDGEIAIGKPDANAEQLQATKINTDPTPTEAPAAFSDDFSTNNAQWPVASNERSEKMISDGIYTINYKAPGIYSVIAVPSLAATTDMGVVTDVAVHGNARAGLAVRSSVQDDQRSFYACWIDGTSHYGCFVTVHGQLTTLAEATPSEAINAGQVNHITMVAVGTQIAFAVNGHTIATFDDTQLASGVPALYAENFDSAAGASFDNVVVR